MEWINRLFAKPVSQTPVKKQAVSVLEPLVWQDTGGSRQEDWQRRLHAFGRRAARELSAAGTPTWDTGAGRSVRHAGQFWLIDLDVYEAGQWYEAATVRRKALVPGFAPGITGYVDGRALLLSTDGDIITAACHGDRVLSKRWLSFENAVTHDSGLQSSAWSWGNSGRWRDKPKKDTWDSVHGYRELQNTMNAEFAGRWMDRNQSKPSGLGTSMTIKKFLERRETNLPRFF